MTDKNILVIYSSQNSGKKHDATGAFIPEAKAFAKVHSVPKRNVIGMKFPRVKKYVRREQVYEAIETVGSSAPIDAIAFFGHGWPDGLQCGCNRKDIPELVECMQPYCKSDVKVTLYACLAAENDVKDRQIKDLGPATDGGFCDVLRDEMVRHGMDAGDVTGHKTHGHTRWNPYWVRFLCSAVTNPEEGATGGAWLIEPGSQLWKPWVKALKDKKGGLGYRLPFMQQVDIYAELMGAQAINMEPLEVRGRRW